jgi:hypothetical protein
VRRLVRIWCDGAIKSTARDRGRSKTPKGDRLDHPPTAERADQERADLARILQRCSSPLIAGELVRDSADILRQHQHQSDRTPNASHTKAE